MPPDGPKQRPVDDCTFCLPLLCGATIRLFADPIRRREDAVVDRPRFSNEPSALKLGFRNKSNDLVHVRFPSLRAAGLKALPEQIRRQIAANEDEPRLARLVPLPWTLTPTLNQHVDALNDKTLIVV